MKAFDLAIILSSRSFAVHEMISSEFHKSQGLSFVFQQVQPASQDLRVIQGQPVKLVSPEILASLVRYISCLNEFLK